MDERSDETAPSVSGTAGAARDVSRSPGESPEILVEGLDKRYDRRAALKGVSFSLERGGFLVVFGPNGAGKTTLLRVLAGLASASAGRVLVAGADVRDDPTPVRRAVGLVSHAPLLYPDLSAYENLRFYADMYGVGEEARERDARICGLLDRVELSVRRNDRVRTFSRGMRQRLAIARAILHGPRVLLLDEPHAGLDARAVAILDALLAEIRGEHTFVMVTHRVDEGLARATQVLVLDEGRVVLDEPCAPDARERTASLICAALDPAPSGAKVSR